ncbi:hypothetical protein CAXC1_20016 [Candidatus Xenohaliotis californiensis]|uniref:Uncharacterized protein n=1 Tax=Candidatus Xenohaliotis californiensis TaxID=84677 RepID=A0ABM9N8A8_9RICK|nr:hypothetical protein CAXC1_20016 [Candidatus Xenohaliotis californiensis]
MLGYLSYHVVCSILLHGHSRMKINAVHQMKTSFLFIDLAKYIMGVIIIPIKNLGIKLKITYTNNISDISLGSGEKILQQSILNNIESKICDKKLETLTLNQIKCPCIIFAILAKNAISIS